MLIRRRILTRLILVAGLLALIAHQAYRHGYEYVFAVRPIEVVPGKLYRGAWQQPWPMTRIVRERHIKTIVALAHPDDHHMALRERELAEKLGVRWVHVPIIDDLKIGHGKTVTELLDQAAQILADPACQPVYFHCHHGLIRTSMAQMAWRTRYCGWTLEQASDEVSRYFGQESLPRGNDYLRVVEYYNARVLPSRATAAKVNVPATTSRR